MKREEYRRKLTRTEAQRHYVYVEKKFAGMFPSSGEAFKVLVGKDKFEVLIDKEGRIWSAIFWEFLPHFNEGDTIIFSKNPDGSFTVSIEK